jgi:hypothetical protein
MCTWSTIFLIIALSFHVFQYELMSLCICSGKMNDAYEEFLYVFPTEGRDDPELINAQKIAYHGTTHIRNSATQNKYVCCNC